jgi:predicted neutral ceramidase superfamily lipid hydrolase
MGMLDQFKEDFKKEKAKMEAKEAAKAKQVTQPTETEKLAKTGNTIIKGVALWYLIPFLAVAAIVGVFFLVWIWDMITGAL